MRRYFCSEDTLHSKIKLMLLKCELIITLSFHKEFEVKEIFNFIIIKKDVLL